MNNKKRKTISFKEVCVNRSIDKYGEDVFKSKESSILLDVLGSIFGPVVVVSKEDDA